MSLPDRDWTFTRILDVRLDEHQRCLYQVEWQDTVWKESVLSFNELTLDGALLSSMASSVRPIGKNQLCITWAPTWLSADELAVDGGLAIHRFWSAKMYLHWSTKSCLKPRSMRLPPNKTPSQSSPLAYSSEMPLDSAMWRYTHLDGYKQDERGNSSYCTIWEDTIWLGAIPGCIRDMAIEIYGGKDPTFPCDIFLIKWRPSWVALEDLLDDGDSLQSFWMNVASGFIDL